jgi:hypothetical protein
MPAQVVSKPNSGARDRSATAESAMISGLRDATIIRFVVTGSD